MITIFAEFEESADHRPFEVQNLLALCARHCAVRRRRLWRRRHCIPFKRNKMA
jgi:hypothetical protein